MMTLAEARDLLRKLQAVRWSGDRRVTYIANGVERTVEHRSDVELRQAIGDVENFIGNLEGRGARVHVIHSHKGWDRTAEGV
jgi:hypothetical protein